MQKRSDIIHPPESSVNSVFLREMKEFWLGFTIVVCEIINNKYNWLRNYNTEFYFVSGRAELHCHFSSLLRDASDIHRFPTSIHSSRMRTAHFLPVSPSMHCAGGVCSWEVCSGGVSAPGGVYSLGGVCFCSSGGGCLLQGGVCLWSQRRTESQQAIGQIPLSLWTEFLIHASENITLLQPCCWR